MPEDKNQSRRKRLIFKTVLVFLVGYLFFLLLWIQMKDVYSLGITHIASHIVALVKDVNVHEISQENDIVRTTFAPLRHQSKMLIDVPVLTSSYTFNAPLTFAIMSSLFIYIRKRWRAYSEALLLLLFVHLLYVFSLEVKELTDIFVNVGFESENEVRIFAYQFLWSFTDNMVIRFEPFLIGFYMYIRFKK